MTPLIYDYPPYLWQLLSGFRAAHEKSIARMRERDLSLHDIDKPSLRVLDLANGRLRPQYYILQQDGYRVCGMDVLNRSKHSWEDFAYQVARWLYKKKICSSASISDENLVCGDVSALPFQDQSIDVVSSVAAFEHFLNVPAVVKEIYRVVKPGGLVWVLIHLFSSPSGGHNVSLTQVPLQRLPRGIAPWDHLRKRRLPFHVPLNEWRQCQYIGEFDRHFEILKHYCAMREGEHLLTREVEAELCQYSRDELTSGAYVIFARRPF